jgi:hypothetical protein
MKADLPDDHRSGDFGSTEFRSAVEDRRENRRALVVITIAVVVLGVACIVLLASVLWLA